MISKTFGAVVYSVFFTLYLIYLDKKNIKCESKSDTFKDLFHTLTFRQKYEDAFKELETKTFELQEAQKIAQLGTYILDINSGFWTSSPVLDDILGIDQKYIRDVPGWLQIIHPKDRAMMQEYLSINILANHEKFDKKYRILKLNDAQERWVHGMGQLEFDDGQNLIRMIGTIQDITSRKLIEEKLKISDDILNQVASLVKVIDKNDNIIYASPSFKAVLGYEPEDILGLGWWIQTTPNLENGD